jgi:la-related protein 1
MYNFWSRFLVTNFNPTMYSEFRDLATEDQARGDEAGFQHLLTFYGGTLKSEKPPITAQVAADMVSFLRKEEGEARPMFKTIRQAWRDGGLNLKSRKRIQDNLNDVEKAQFDKNG